MIWCVIDWTFGYGHIPLTLNLRCSIIDVGLFQWIYVDYVLLIVANNNSGCRESFCVAVNH